MFILISSLLHKLIDLIFLYSLWRDPYISCLTLVRLSFFISNHLFEFDDISAPICLPEKNEDFLGKFGWAAGWGALNPGSRLRPKTLQSVDVPVIENRWAFLLNVFEFEHEDNFLILQSMRKMASTEWNQRSHLPRNAMCWI